MNKPARFTQAELRRAIRAAKAEGVHVAVRNGEIHIDPEKPYQILSTEPTGRQDGPVAPPKGFVL